MSVNQGKNFTFVKGDIDYEIPSTIPDLEKNILHAYRLPFSAIIMKFDSKEDMPSIPVVNTFVMKWACRPYRYATRFDTYIQYLFDS